MPPNKNSRVCHFSYNDRLNRASTGEPIVYQRYGIMKKKEKIKRAEKLPREKRKRVDYVFYDVATL